MPSLWLLAVVVALATLPKLQCEAAAQEDVQHQFHWFSSEGQAVDAVTGHEGKTPAAPPSFAPPVPLAPTLTLLEGPAPASGSDEAAYDGDGMQAQEPGPALSHSGDFAVVCEAPVSPSTGIGTNDERGGAVTVRPRVPPQDPCHSHHSRCSMSVAWGWGRVGEWERVWCGVDAHFACTAPQRFHHQRHICPTTTTTTTLMLGTAPTPFLFTLTLTLTCIAPTRTRTITSTDPPPPALTWHVCR
jgi:hypothetical protein